MSSYVNGLLMAVLKPALTSYPLDPAAQVGTKLPSDYVEHLPFVQARLTPGGITRTGTRFTAPIQVDVYALEGRAAHDLGDACVAALTNAWSAQQVTTDGHIAAFTNVSGPSEFPESDRADGVVRYLIIATLTARPPAA